LANATGLLNSGTLLRALSRAHVNVVLHGHEHYRNLARFGASEENSSDVVVVAAGSGTGEKTGVGWALPRVHFNVLELHDDGSVRLREVFGAANSASVTYSDGRRTLLTAEDIRRA